MKKTVLFAAAIFTACAASAQTGETTSNRGENWLSQDGDWGLTFDANPLLNYAGNLFNGNSNNSIGNGLTWANSWYAIQGKKLVDANTAYRGKLRIGINSDKATVLVPQSPLPSPLPNSSPTVENVTKNSSMNIVLGAGLEKRVGSTRVVGVYGAELLIAFGNSKTTYEYGNALTTDNQEGGAYRPTEVKNGSTFGLGLNAFAGVEWFCAPKVSLSGEYTWGLMMSSVGLGSTTEEHWDATANNNLGAVSEHTIDGNPDGDPDKSSSFGLDTGVSGASIGVNFYFQ